MNDQHQNTIHALAGLTVGSTALTWGAFVVSLDVWFRIGASALSMVSAGVFIAYTVWKWRHGK